MAFLNWIFCVGTAALILLAVTSSNGIFEPHHAATIGTQIESPLRNTCQSGDLLPDFPKCSSAGRR